MRQHKNTQIGSLLIEMVAVIGLIALITPILFHQIHKRNEEIVNTQIATEMRAIKDAMASYIQANEKTIATNVGIYNAVTEQYEQSNEYCDLGTVGNDSSEYLPISGMKKYFPGNGEAILPDYFFDLCYYTVPTNEADGTYRPVIYGVAVQREGMGSIRRASKVASLIGLEGGVATSDSGLMGMQGVWELPISGLDPTAVGVISSFDDASNASLLKDVRWQHMQSDTVQADTIVAGKRLGVKEVLTVDTSTNCIADYGSGTVQIKATNDGTDSTCTPFFEVNPTTKEVRLAGTIRTGIAVSGATCSSFSKKQTCTDAPNCVWVEASASDETGRCLAEYLLNPAGTSVMEDIKLSSRGGAKLSDLLPTWILKETRYFASGDKEEENVTAKKDYKWSVAIPTCPTGYSPAITVVPSQIQPHIFSISAGAIKQALTQADTERVGLEGGFRLTIRAGDSDFSAGEGWLRRPSTDATIFEIRPEAWDEVNEKWVDTLEREDLTFSALVQTYCFWNTNEETN